MANQDKDGKYLLPLSIIIAALLIVGAVIYSAGLKNVKQPAVEKKQEAFASDIENIRPVNEKDHIRGNFNALVKIVEFSDMECPYCKMFHQTMLRVMEEYGKDGKVAWIYRHYPLPIHSKAKKSALAAECAAELAGNDGFWNYLDGYFEITPSNNLINLSDLPKIAENIGLDKTRFEECLESGRYDKLIEEQAQNALDSGARGTPYSVIIAKDGEKYPIGGALPYEQIKEMIESALK